MPDRWRPATRTMRRGANAQTTGGVNRRPSMAEPGPLFIIGGGEDREGERIVLRAFAEEVAGRKVVLATIATQHPEDYAEMYRGAFADLPIGELDVLHADNRADALDPAQLGVLEDAGAVFFTGGDQLRLSSQLGDTPIGDRIREIWNEGRGPRGHVCGGLG